MPKRGWRESFRWWLDPTIPVRHLSDTQDRREGIYACIDRQKFDWRVFAVAASGFLTDSYNLFATNIILPAIAFIYWRNSNDDTDPNSDVKGKWEVAINIATLGGSVVGQLLFGFLADRFGRRKLYGLELIIVIVSTLGLAQASAGFYNQKSGANSMSIQAWLIFYRLLQGIGIGGEYPMSAVITAEFASVRSRARMMAAVFSMQPLGQMLAAVIGIGVIYGYSSSDPTKFGPNYVTPWQAVDANPEDDGILGVDVQVDKVWRWVIGVGAIPAFIAILFRFTIPESPRYTLDVDEDASRALRDALAHYGSTSTVATGRVDTTISADVEMSPHPDQRAHHRRNSFDISPGASRRSSVISAESVAAPVPTVQQDSFTEGFRKYLFDQGNWRWLLGASLVWFVLDFAFYGLGVNNPRTLAKIWASQFESTHSTTANATYEDSWNSDINMGSPLSNDGDNIFFILRNDAIRSLITSTLGSLVGSILIIQIIPYVPRKTMLVWTFLLLSVLMIITGGVLLATFETDGHAAVITLYVIIQLIFNLGPNTLIFIYPAEIFPTRYRGTCYGIASASGKLAAVIVQAILPYAQFGNWVNRLNVNDAHALSFLWIIWGIMMIFGAYFAWLWLPHVQRPRGEGEPADGFRIPNMTLEELAKGGDFKSKSSTRSGIRERIPFFSKESDGRSNGGPNGRANGNVYEMRDAGSIGQAS